jgi:hypothetical protein
MKIIVALACCLISVSALAQKTYVLKQDYPVGKRYDYAINSDQIVNQKVAGKESDFIQNIGTDYTFEVKEAQGTDKNINVIYKRINMKSVGMGRELIIDSDKEEAGKQNPFAGLRNASFSMILSSNGSVKSISGMDKMISEMARKMTSDTTQIKPIIISLSKQFNAEVVRQTMESSLKIFPDKPIKIGDSWTINTKMHVTMPVESITTYTLKEVNGNVAVLAIRGTLISKGEFDSMGNKMTSDLKGLNVGDAQVDLKTGMILNSHTRTELYGKMKSVDQDIDFDIQGINKVVGKGMN